MIAVLDNIRSIHNVGSIFRTADAAGIKKIYLCGITPAPIDRFGMPNEQLAKVALGAQKIVAWEQVDTTLNAVRKLQEQKYHVIALEQDSRARSLFDLSEKRDVEKLALVVGTEVDGIAEEVLRQVDEIVDIPMRGAKESLNVSVAFGVAAYHLLNAGAALCKNRRVEITEEHVILVDENDNSIGIAEKVAAHANAQLHRAFSVFVFNSKGELMLQRRAKTKYHCGGLWSNTCCSHPRLNEPINEGARRRLREEMGFDCPLKEQFSFKYKISFDNGLTENEYDHVFVGRYDGEPKMNPDEAQDWRWVSLPELERGIDNNPAIYTHWLKIALPRVKELIMAYKNDK